MADDFRPVHRGPCGKFAGRCNPCFGTVNTFNGIAITSMDANKNVGERGQIGLATAAYYNVGHSSTGIV